MKNQSFIDSVLQNRWLSHVLFWVTMFSLFTVLASLNTGQMRSHVIIYLSTLPVQIAAAYVLNYYQLPQLLYKKKYVLFTLSMVASIYIYSALGRISVVYVAEPFVRTDFKQESILEILSDTAYLFSIYFTSIYVYAFVMLLIKTIKDRFEERHKIEILQKEKATNELKFLRGQIQPHFLFNTLNNLYALTLSKSDLAPKVVLKLSELLDFILYQSDEKSVPISKEIELIEGFIELETLRYGERVSVNFNVEVENNDVQISPLLLLPLVENAFKHGVGGGTRKVEINIDLKLRDSRFMFKIFNTKSPGHEAKGLKRSGIGTSNLKRQLALNYPNKHILDIEESDTTYLVRLSINLNSETT